VIEVPEHRSSYLDELRPVVDFMRQQYWHVYDPEERKRMLAAMDAFTRADTQGDNSAHED